MHLPRSVGLFRKAGWRVIPYPVDYGSSGRVVFAPSVRFLEKLGRVDDATREWVGLVSYRLLGRIDALFPDR
jgi:uncharacterized SAM-binding protein YcdF (DUF218 family)